MHMALYELLLENYPTKSHTSTPLRACSEPVNQFQEARARSPVDKSTSQEFINAANERLIRTLTDESIIEQQNTWEKKCSNAMINVYVKLTV